MIRWSMTAVLVGVMAMPVLAGPPATVAGAATAPAVEVGHPSAVIENEHARVHVYLPDAEDGYYRGARFDWSGLVSRVEYGEGHTLFGERKEKRNPTAHDDLGGTAEEFGMERPVGYAEAAPGETFIKIGVGKLRKLKDEKYRFSGKYPIVEAAPWEVTKEDGAIEFAQSLTDERGWGYAYVKRVELMEDRPGFVITRTLKNTGTRPIETDHYGHNFVLLDDKPVGPGYELTYGHALKPAIENVKTKQARLEGDRLTFAEPIPRGAAVWIPFVPPATAGENWVAVRQTETGAGVRIENDFVPSKVVFYGEVKAACPEPFVEMKLGPGEERTWRTTYALGGGG